MWGFVMFQVIYLLFLQDTEGKSFNSESGLPCVSCGGKQLV